MILPINNSADQQGLYQDGNSIFDNVYVLGGVDAVGIITATRFIGDGSQLTGIDASTIKDANGNIQIQGTLTGATHSGRAVFNELEVESKLYDGDGNFGSSGQVLSSDGTDTAWVNTGSLTAGAASEVGITAVNSNSNHFITFVDSSSGNENVKVDTNLTYNPSTNAFGNINVDGLHVLGNLRIDGQLKDGDNLFGGAGTVLTSDGTDTKWDNVGNLAAGSAAKISISENDTQTDARILFSNSPGQSGGNSVFSDNQLTYNANTNILGFINASFSGNLTGASGSSVSATSITGTLQTAAQTNITSVGTLSGLTVGGNISQTGSSNYISIAGGIKDKDGDLGTVDQVLTSTGTQVNWANVSGLAAGTSAKITITESDADTNFRLTFSNAPGQTGGNDLLSDNQLTYNANDNILTAGNFSGGGANLTSLNANNITSGDFGTDRIENNAVTFAKLENIATNTILGRTSSGTGDTEELSVTSVKTLLSYDTDDVSEGSSNQYFTTARARAAISASGDITYDNSTGVISFSESSDNNTTYLLKARRESGGGNAGNDTDPFLFLDASSGTDDSVRLVGSGSVSVTRNSDGQITISGTDTNTDTNTTYSLLATGGANPSLKLDGTSGTDTSVQIRGTGSAGVNRNSNTQITIDVPVPASVNSMRSSDVQTNSESYQTAISVTINPTATNSVLMITGGGGMANYYDDDFDNPEVNQCEVKLFRGGSQIGSSMVSSSARPALSSGNGFNITGFCLKFRDTSSHSGNNVTYHLKFRRFGSNGNGFVKIRPGTSLTVEEII